MTAASAPRIRNAEPQGWGGPLYLPCQNLHFDKIPEVFMLTLQCGKHWSIQTLLSGAGLELLRLHRDPSPPRRRHSSSLAQLCVGHWEGETAKVEVQKAGRGVPGEACVKTGVPCESGDEGEGRGALPTRMHTTSHNPVSRLVPWSPCPTDSRIPSSSLFTAHCLSWFCVTISMDPFSAAKSRE